MFSRATVTAAWVSVGLLLAWSGMAAEPARAQSQNLSEALFGQGRGASAPAIAKYVAGDDREFVLDRSGARPLLKFEDSAEVWVLTPTPGPRGDVIYRDDLGRTLVRSSRLGGLTLFTPDRPSGMPAALAGQAVAIRPVTISPATLFTHFARAAARASRAVRKNLMFQMDEDATPGTATLFADAAGVAAEGIARFSRQRGSGEVLGRLKRVRFGLGRRPEARVAGDSLEITIAPGQGLAGRPSSERIVRAMSAAD